MNKKASYILIIIIIALLVGFNIISNTNKEKAHEEEPVQMADGHNHSSKKVLDATLIIKDVAVIETNKGTFEIAILKKDIPEMSKRFMSLVKKDGYKDSSFVNVNPWMVQIGELSTKLEYLHEEKAYGLDAYRGAVGMARLQKKGTATSSFFVVKEISPSVAEEYTLFGYVVKGMDVIDQIEPEDKIISTSLRKSDKDDETAIVEVFNNGRNDRGTFEMFKMKVDADAKAKEMREMMEKMTPPKQ